MQHTISENLVNNLLDTLRISCIFYTSKVKILKNTNNPQVTKASNSLVGTSEAIRMLNVNTKLTKKTKENIKWNPNFITGFTDAEGCFHVSLRKAPGSGCFGWRVEPKFQIKLSVKDLSLLNKIKNFFEVGNISTGSAEFFVTQIKDFSNVITPQFLDYPLITQKKADFLLFLL